MGADIHWIIEREHLDGSWEAVASKYRLQSELGYAFSQISMSDPRMRFGERDYVLFGILSGSSRSPVRPHHTLAVEGLPEDASDHARLALGADDDIFDGYHSQGHFTLGRLRDVVREAPDDIVPDTQAHGALSQYLLDLEALISGKIDLDTILHGPQDDQPGDMSYPSMASESNHARITRLQRQGELLPIGRNTLRVLIAYDS